MTRTAERSGQEFRPRFEDGRAMLIAALGGRYGSENRHEIPVLWRHFGPKYFGRTPGQVDKKTYGVCANMDGEGNLDYFAGVEVSRAEGLPSELRLLRIAPHRYAVFAHEGHISEIGRGWMDIFEKWLPQSGYALAAAPSFECYGEAFDPEVAIGNVEIWLAVDRRNP
jgi:AraC family transcriptional regulator